MAGTIKKDIAGITYESSSFPPFDWILMGGRVAKVVGPSMIGILLSAMGSGSLKSVLSQDSSVLISAVTGALGSLQPKDFQALCLDLLKNTWQGPTPGRNSQLQLDSETKFNMAFLDDPGAVWGAIWLALEANDFFVGGGLGKRLRAKLVPPVSPEPSNPTSSMS